MDSSASTPSATIRHRQQPGIPLNRGYRAERPLPGHAAPGTAQLMHGIVLGHVKAAVTITSRRPGAFASGTQAAGAPGWNGPVSQAGTLLLAEALRVTGLGQGLFAGLARWRVVQIIADLVVTLALGGDCLADVAVLRARPELAGPVASDPVISPG